MTDKVIAPMQPPLATASYRINSNSKHLLLRSTGIKVFVSGDFTFSGPDEVDPTNALNEIIPTSWQKRMFTKDNMYSIRFSAETFMYELCIRRDNSDNIVAIWGDTNSDDKKPQELSLTYQVECGKYPNEGGIDVIPQWDVTFYM